MKALDTNILVRFLVNDDRHQGEKVRAVLGEAEKLKESYLVTDLVTLELIWVLGAVYDAKRDEIIRALEDLLLLDVFVFENRERIQIMLQKAKTNNVELSDLFIGVSALALDCTATVTFDKKASKSNLFELL